MPIEFDKQDELPALNFFWDDPQQYQAGGELRILELTKDNEHTRTLIENSAVVIGEVSDFLFWILREYEDDLPHALLHGFCWQALRDLRASMFLALCGRYRQANMLHRSAVETTAYGVYFEPKPDEKGEYAENGEYAAWISGKGGDEVPSFGDVKQAVRKLDPPMSKDIADYLGRRWGEVSTVIHAPRGGDIDKVMHTEEGKSPIHPWSAYFDVEQAKQWYENFINDVFFVGYVITQFWNLEEADVTSFLPRFYEDVSDGRVHGIAGEVEFEL